MNRAILCQRIADLLAEVERLNRTLRAMNGARLPHYELLSTDAALRAERIACRLRHLIYATTAIQKEDYLTSAAVMQGIQIQAEDGILEITLPGLLPKRRQKESTEYLLDPFRAALAQYVRQRPGARLDHCVVCFTHVYSRELPERRIRDYDNLELKQLLDVAASFLLADDSGLLCDVYHTTQLGPQDCTRISIMPGDRFPQWLSRRRNA